MRELFIIRRIVYSIHYTYSWTMQSLCWRTHKWINARIHFAKCAPNPTDLIANKCNGLCDFVIKSSVSACPYPMCIDTFIEYGVAFFFVIHDNQYIKYQFACALRWGHPHNQRQQQRHPIFSNLFFEIWYQVFTMPISIFQFPAISANIFVLPSDICYANNFSAYVPTYIYSNISTSIHRNWDMILVCRCRLKKTYSKWFSVQCKILCIYLNLP